MSDEEKKISLVNLKGGAVVEMFDRCLDAILKNLSDPNTEPKARREIVLKAVFQATEDRAVIGMNISCTPKLTAQRPLITTAFIRGGEMIENKPRQMGIFTDNVHLIKKGE